MTNTAETFACLVTPSQPGGIAVIQVSGPKALSVFQGEFQGKRQVSNPGRLYYGLLFENSQKTPPPIDEILLSLSTKESSFTGEPLLEINCHGGDAIVNAIFQLLESKGVLRVPPEKILERAEQNEKLRKLEKSALGHLLESKTELSARVFTYQFNGVLREELESIIKLISLSSEKAFFRVKDLVKTSALSQALLYPKTIVFAGHPNAGKSTLLNLFFGRERVLVDATPGTTRDAITSFISIRGIPFCLTDTAGLRQTKDVIESMGIELTYEMLEKADEILWIIDASLPPDEKSLSLYQTELPHCQVGLNKIDQKTNYLEKYKKIFPQAFSFSALTGEGIPQMEELWLKDILPLIEEKTFPVIFGEENISHLEKAREHLEGNRGEEAEKEIREILW